MKLSLPQIEALAASYVAKNKISTETFNITRENTAGLLDKIGKIITYDTSFRDKLLDFDGEELSFGKTVEEWSQDLTLPQDYDSTGANALKPADPTYRPAFYSYTLGEKTFKTTIRKNDFERAVHFPEQLARLVSMIMKRLYDSKAVWDYEVKREALGKLISFASDEMAPTDVYDAAGVYAVNKLLKSAVSNGVPGIVVKPMAASVSTRWDDAVAKGFIVPLDLITTIAKPVDTETGEAFIEQVKKDVEISQDLSEGHSLNGNTLGVAEEGMILFLRQGIMPNIEVQTMAGAFNRGDVAFPVEIRVIKDFGSADSNIYGLLMDKRGMRKFNSYRGTDSDHNGEGHFENYYLSTEDTINISRNTFVKVYKAA